MRSLLDLFFPPRCAACRALLHATERPSTDLPLCVPCGATLVPVVDACDRCGEPLGGEWPCKACAVRRPTFDRFDAVYRYGGAVAELLHRYKYEDHPELARPLSLAMARLALPVPDVVMAVPLHATRRRDRTYDQALLLATGLARHRGWRLSRGLLHREVATERQVGQSRDARAKNVAGAFRVLGRLSGERVMLVDDVVTTGATADECARALKEAGANTVHVVALARA